MRDENGRLRKVLNEKDYEINQLKKRVNEEKEMIGKLKKVLKPSFNQIDG